MTTRKADWGKRTATKKTPGTTVELDDRVEVPVTVDQVWSRLEDVPLVASCLPGLDPGTLVAESDTRFRATMVNTVMGISANWDLHATIEPNSIDRRLRVLLEGTDARLNMKMNGVAEVTVVPGADATQAALDYNASLRIDGSLAAMGGPVVRSIMADALDQFISVVGGVEPTRARGPWARFKGLLRALWTAVFGAR
jgi:carbon monoxide dehydrogenase subunit G